jgi:hypothetical protein
MEKYHVSYIIDDVITAVGIAADIIEAVNLVKHASDVENVSKTAMVVGSPAVPYALVVLDAISVIYDSLQNFLI